MMTAENKMERCAILLMSIGEEAAAEVLRHMGAHEVQELGAAMIGMRNMTRNSVNQVLEQFRKDADQFLSVNLGSEEYIRAILNKALGADRAAGILEDILDLTKQENGIEALNQLEPANIAELIAGEHPQIIATILVHLDRDLAADTLALLTERVRNDVIIRIATFGGVQPTALRELTDVLNSVLSGQTAKRSKMGGVRAAAEILNTMNAGLETSMITHLQERDAELAQRVQEEMFTFENLADLDDITLQTIMAEITDNNMLVLALKGASEEVRERFFKNMSNRAAQMLRDEIQDMNRVRASVVQAEQRAIIGIARRLADTGQISLSKTSDDDYV
ncbi:flagellar motor switch protein FliG [Advenella sp. EE-W14]|uniref:flagellar motor switch protein FliG n=1 Tax=Advenella sp. EE-W14 TaxID=2722705 RepID=UPI00145D0EA7|nr:flagellar motor switch protein FliG [Advenella sp. EE-W14]